MLVVSSTAPHGLGGGPSSLTPLQPEPVLHLGRPETKWPKFKKQVCPLIWLHVPKCGTSFATTIAHWIDPSLPHDYSVKPCPGDLPEHTRKAPCGPNEHPLKDKRRCLHRFDNGHMPLEQDFAKKWHNVKLVMMERHPVSRVISGFKHNLHDCTWLQEKHGCTASQTGQPAGCGANITEYAACVRGCVTRMLTGQHCARKTPEDDEAVPTTSRQQAVSMIREHVGFIGLTEHWAESVCLWHTMFGGDCLSAAFENARASRPEQSEEKAWEAQLASIPDDDDAAVFEAASTWFWAAVKLHDITPSSCAALCRDVDPRLFDMSGTDLRSQAHLERASVSARLAGQRFTPSRAAGSGFAFFDRD